MPSGYEQQRERMVESLERNKEELRTAVQDLGETVRHKVQEVRDRVKVTNRIGERPALWLASSFGLGLLLGTRNWWGRALREAGF